MKKIYLLIWLALFPPNIFSQTHWKKHNENPVFTPGSYGEWDDRGVQPGSVLYLDSAYHMWYTGKSREAGGIGYASSPDGLNWTKYEGNPVLESGPPGSWDGGGSKCPYVLFQNGVFHMWYTGQEGLLLNEDYNIGHATSKDGIHWTKDLNNPVLKVGVKGSWDGGRISLGSVILDGSVYQMWYIGWKGGGGAGSNLLRIGYATSTDGTTWTKGPQNPILVPEPGASDFQRLDAPNVLFDGTSYKMWYLDGVQGSKQMSFATSEDGVNWTKSATNPVLKKGPEGNWDDSTLGWHAVLDSAKVKFKMWYGASDDPNRIGSIGYAESDTRVPTLTLCSGSLLDPTMTLEVETSLDGAVYILPLKTELLVDSILKCKVRSTDVAANTPIGIPLTGIYSGQYFVVAISEFGYVCYQGLSIEIADDLTPPEVKLEKESIGSGEPIVASSSKDGVLFLVDDITPSKLNYIRSGRFLIDSTAVQADIPVEFVSDRLEPDEYRLFAIDKFGSLSNPKNITLVTGINQSVSDKNWVSIYPNPTDKKLMIHQQTHGDYSVRIITLRGQEVICFEWKGGSKEFDLSTINPGLYLITITSEDRRWTGKLVKHQ